MLKTLKRCCGKDRTAGCAEGAARYPPRALAAGEVQDEAPSRCKRASSDLEKIGETGEAEKPMAALSDRQSRLQTVALCVSKNATGLANSTADGNWKDDRKTAPKRTYRRRRDSIERGPRRLLGHGHRTEAAKFWTQNC